MRNIFIIFVLFLLAACGAPAPQVTVTPQPTVTLIPPTPSATVTATFIPAPTATPETLPAAAEAIKIPMGPLPGNAIDIPEVLAVEGMTVANILDQAKLHFKPWDGILATDLMPVTHEGQGGFITFGFNMNGTAGNARQIPVENLPFMLDQSQVNAFFPDMLPYLEDKWDVPLDKILMMPSVVHTENGDIFFLGFTDGVFTTGDNVRPNTFSKFQTCVGSDRTETAVALFNFGQGAGDAFNSSLSLNVASQAMMFVDEDGKESTMRLGDIWAKIANFINSPLREGESKADRVAAINAMFAQMPVPVGCVLDKSFNAVK